MFGYRDEFEYFSCSSCGSIQIAEIPADLAKYYPPQYYSFSKKARIDGSITRFIMHRRARSAMGHQDMLGGFTRRIYGVPRWADWIKIADLDFNDAIADVGSGGGYHLAHMYNHGFSDLTGIDPFIEKSVELRKGLRLLKCELSEVDRSFDFIMLNHSIEHVEDPIQTLLEINRLLKEERFALVRTPVAGSYAWREYGADWVQLDAPRHICIPTEEGMRIMAAKAGLELKTIVYDSTAFQYWGSEQYRQDIPLHDQKSFRVLRDNSIFSRAEMETYQVEAKELNRTSQGDQACFFLWKGSDSAN